MVIFDEEALGVTNLVVGFPGKATSFLRLGEALAARVRTSRRVLAYPA
jgi:hypothetical protein